jgi:hypothetical protein
MPKTETLIAPKPLHGRRMPLGASRKTNLKGNQQLNAGLTG